MPFLAAPSVIYKKSYIEAAQEFEAERWPLRHLPDDLDTQFGEFVQDLLRRSNSATQDPDLVPETFLWLVDRSKFIGFVHIRHALNDFLLKYGGHIGYAIRPSRRRRGLGTLALKLGLEKAREIGLTRVLLICDSDNIGSSRIIEANGGVFEKEEALEMDGVPVVHRRYWIEIP
jgi:predicted acetyltransferase